MRQSALLKIVILIAISFLFACTDVVDVGVPNGGKRLVVEANILWEKGTTGNQQVVKLSYSSPYFSTTDNLKATGAVVYIENDTDGSVANFIEQEEGLYMTNEFVPTIGQTYTLKIELDGQIYEGQETLMAVPEITRIEQTTESDFGGEEIVVNFYFNDPEGERNYYLADFASSVQPFLSLEAFNDEFSDGLENFMEYEESDIEAGVVVDYRLQGLSSRYYNYIAILLEQSGDGGGPFQSPPVQLKGNCKNVNNNSEEVLGYFYLSEMVKGEYEIE